jgi:hypothetical protein
MRQKTIVVLLTILLTASLLYAAKVYLVLGSDTAIWNGMSVSRYHNIYHPGLYTDADGMAAKVMDAQWRNQILDSNGRPVVFTWWMMAGNIFRYATNLNMPIPNIMTLYLMKKHHHEAIAQFGDELSLHYHTFLWSDYDQDGIWFWNQSLTFLECSDDFDVTLAQFLLDEAVFPVSFRSGWHYMDNDWQHRLDELLPFSMHNDWPHRRVDTVEPLDNTYDWYDAPTYYKPYRPSYENYQLPGGDGGWNLRSVYFSTAWRVNHLDSLFAAASSSGEDQIVCFWAHLPETDFLSNVENINAKAHEAAEKYPDVSFEYVTAIEGMQKYLGSGDTIAPQIEVTPQFDFENTSWTVSVDEPIFQKAPVFALRDCYGNETLLEGTPAGSNIWHYSYPLNRSSLAKWSIAVCDSMGNQTIETFHEKADDRFFDDGESTFTPLGDNWQTVADDFAWNQSQHIATIDESGKDSVQWQVNLPIRRHYQFFLSHRGGDYSPDSLKFSAFQNGNLLFSKMLIPDSDSQWLLSAIEPIAEAGELTLRFLFFGQEGQTVLADALKISELVPPKFLHIRQESVDLYEQPAETLISGTLTLESLGSQAIHVSDFAFVNGNFNLDNAENQTIASGESYQLGWSVYQEEPGFISDTLIIYSDDPIHTVKKIPFSIQFRPWFVVLDNDNPEVYREEGQWFTSVTQAYGASSRYSPGSGNSANKAFFSVDWSRDGRFLLEDIVPTTVNSVTAATYKVYINQALQGEHTVNQNEESGGWRHLGEYEMKDGDNFSLVINYGGPAQSGMVLRADAIRLTRLDETELSENVPAKFILHPVYPNPFNSIATFRFQLPERERLTLNIYNLKGQLIHQQTDVFTAGEQSWQVDFSGQASGIYFYRLQNKTESRSGKIMLVK